MPGSSASPATPVFVINTIIADILREYSAELEENLKIKDLNSAIISLVKDRYKKHKRIIFNGNGYEQKWVDEARRLGLPNLKNTVEGLPALIEEDSIQLFERNNVLTRSEVLSRFHVYTDRYNKQSNIEVGTAIRITRNQVYPFIMKYISNVSKSIHRSRKIFPDDALFDLDIEHLKEIIVLKNEMVKLSKELEERYSAAVKIEEGFKRALFYSNEVLAKLAELRKVVDEIEEKIATDKWPIPNYYDLLFNL
jgi:hypothetical protein